MPEFIYVLAPDGRPLMPTKRRRHVRRLLDKGKARITRHVPFTIQLKYDTQCITQPVILGIDPGRTNIGVSAVKKNGELLFSAVAETRNKEIRKLMEERKAHRRASRSGERKARQRLAKRHGTMLAAGFKMRHLPGYGKDSFIQCNIITNSQARFCNRKRKEDWTTPTVRQLVETHVNLVKKVQHILPVTDVAMEVNRFAFALMEHPEITGLDFQNGPLKGFDSVKEAVDQEQHGKCLLCNRKKIEHYHHLKPKHEGGSNTMENIAGLCLSCHELVHTDKEAKAALLEKKAGMLKKYGALSAINQALPYIAARLAGLYPEHVRFVTGRDTSMMRDSLGFEKTREFQMHEADAYCIALCASGRPPKSVPDFSDTYEIRQFRRHDRQLVHAQRERIYKLGKDTVAKNRRPRFEQKGDALSVWYEKQVQLHGRKEADAMRSRLTVTPSRRYYKDPDRLMPGAVFLYRGKRYILTGQMNNGTRYIGCGMEKSVSISECHVIRKNEGLVFC